MKNYVYSFGGGTADGDGKMKDVLGGKGAGLAEMSRAGVPVPPGFTISTEVCNIYFENNNKVPEEINEQILKALDKLEAQIGKKLGDPDESAAGQRPLRREVLHAGHDEHDSQPRPERQDRGGSGQAHRQSALRLRFLPPLHSDVRRSRARYRHGEVRPHLRCAQAQGQGQARYRSDRRRSARPSSSDYKKLVQKETKKPFPQDAREQLAMSRDAVFRSWWNPKAAYYRKMEKIPDEIGTAANVQAMVFGNMGDTSATGVGFTRDPATGEKTFYGEFLINAQGEDVVAGIRTPQPISRARKDHARRVPAAARDHRRASNSIIATCRISSSPSKKASCTCCKRATANAPVRRRFASRSRWSKKA